MAEMVVEKVEKVEKKKTTTKKTTTKKSTAKKSTTARKKNLVIVESPAKASTIGKFLGSNYKIEASMGHIRDLPKSELGVDIEHDFEPRYITIRGKGPMLAKLRAQAKNADKIYLATDPDREGEAISWHLVHALKLNEGKDVRRISFNEITKTAVKRSIEEAREIDMDLVDAQQARRVLDRMVGYSVSTLLWQKVKKGLSGGRVQSVALRIICDREDAIREFIPEEYWSLEATLQYKKKNSILTKFYGKDGKKVDLTNEAETMEIVNFIADKQFLVKEVKTGERQKKPQAPFTTSTMQQESSKHLNMTSQKTMMVAQELYEGVTIKGEGTVGIVSYIRTDSVRISDEAFDSVTEYIEGRFGEDFVNRTREVHKTKRKTQDAHEAIRPTDVLRTPDSIKESLTNDQYKLYKLVWERFVASQMMPAIYNTVAMQLEIAPYDFRSSGSSLKFSGHLEIYNKGDDEEKEKEIPILEKGELLNAKEVRPEQHFTQPPARFSDASLIKTLEEIGVGRPSTYAPTLTTIQARRYVVKEAKNLYPTELGEVVNGIMVGYFSDIVDVDFTANLEKQLDEVEDGNEEWKQVIREFYPEFQVALEDATEKLEKVVIKDEETDVICEKCGTNMVIKYGRYGKFLACPAFPDCQNAKPFFEEAGVDCPECNGKVLIRKTKKGRAYYGCENHPECEFMSWNKPTGEKCPVCSSFLEEKGKKNVKIVCSNEKCNYIMEKPEEEAKEE
ncbi:MAG: type I DNA topoisomerase [Bacillota bacterium]